MKKKLVWDKTGERLYETGVSQGVLYPIQTGVVYNSGTAWNGLSTVTEEIRPGVWGEKITVRDYYGDVIRNTRQYQSSDNLNDNLNVSNEFSIVADPFAYANFHSMRFIEYMGAKWKISNVEVQYPRLILTVGGVYNEQTTETA